LAHLYSRENEAEARQAKVLTADEGRHIAANIARCRNFSGRRIAIELRTARPIICGQAVPADHVTAS
jgi:hypothetical protein